MVSNPDDKKSNAAQTGAPPQDRDHYQSVRALATRLKGAMNPRIRVAPAADALNWVAPHRSHLGGIESSVIDVILGFTFGRGQKWTAIDAIAISQIVNQVFALDGKPQTESQRISVTRAIRRLIEKGLIRRIRSGRKGSHRSDFFYPGITIELLARPHLYHENPEVDREMVDLVLADLLDVERAGEVIWGSHVTAASSERGPDVTQSGYVSGNETALPLDVTVPNHSLSRRDSHRKDSQEIPTSPSPPPEADGVTKKGATQSTFDAIDAAKSILPWTPRVVGGLAS